ncbi:MAG: molybdopterin cofactor-binding domain-containing protein [Pseudomonadota bacterium]
MSPDGMQGAGADSAYRDDGETLVTSFSLNGREVSVRAHPSSRLTAVLRDELGETGTKVGCDAGDCGACTVSLNGKQVCACLTALGQVQGQSVFTIEGQSEPEPATDTKELSVLQQAFHDYGAAQCGICTPGMVMAAQDLLDRVARPTEAEVLDAIGGVLCRCTGYRKIVDAILSVGVGTSLGDIRSDGHVGSALPRLDGFGKISGADAYGADDIPQDALWLRVVRSRHHAAQFTLGDLQSVVDKTPGLDRILTAEDVPVNSFGIYPHLKDQPVLADGFVRYRGEAVLALVGKKAVVEQFNDDTLPISWQALPEVMDTDAATADGAPTLHENSPGNVLIRGHVERGEVAAALQGSAVTSERFFETSFVEHGYIEPEAGYAFCTETGTSGDTTSAGAARMTVVVSTQTPYMDRDEIAHVLGLSGPEVRVTPTACGGGFGGKLDMSVQPLVAVASWQMKRPVACVYSRTESMAASTKRHPSKISARAAADSTGKLTAFGFDGDFNTGAYASWGPTVAGRVPVHATGPYFVPNILNRSRAIYTNGPPSGAFRGFGVPQSAIAHECLMDDLAEQLQMDPLEFRALNAIKVGDKTATGQVLEASVGQGACLDALRPHWKELRAQAEQRNANSSGPIRHGVGVGCMWYGCGNTSMSNPSEMVVGLTKSGQFVLFNGAMEIGQGSGTIMAQICAEALGIPVQCFSQIMGVAPKFSKKIHV